MTAGANLVTIAAYAAAAWAFCLVAYALYLLLFRRRRL